MKWRMVLFSAPTLLLILYAHFYLYRRLVLPLSPRKAVRNVLIASSIFAFAMGFLARFFNTSADPDLLRALTTAAMIWSGFLLYLLFVTVALHVGAAARARWRRRLGDDTALPSPERRAILQHALTAGSVIVAGGLSAYGTMRAFVGPEITETVIALPRLPRTLDGLTIVQLTDIHVGPLIQRAFLRTLVEKANAARPDLIVITGDLVDGRVERLAGFVGELSRLQARFGVHFITGNHDYYSGADAWSAFVASLGINVMRNTSAVIGDAGGALRLLGVDDFSAPRFGEPGYDLDRALVGVRPREEATVLLAHQPANFDEVAARGIGLQISGHTHGGQFFPVTLGARAIWGERSRGLSRMDASALYVSRGCGFVGPPFRVDSPPEIAKIVLVCG
ncbi:MAG: metallophosphoesterase [Deltaproteobacteria bacterium]|nr:metallophosphoesterase [Deltaproteobacteria bacterium]